MCGTSIEERTSATVLSLHLKATLCLEIASDLASAKSDATEFSSTYNRLRVERAARELMPLGVPELLLLRDSLKRGEADPQVAPVVDSVSPVDSVDPVDRKAQVMRAYAEAIVEGTKLGFSDDDWDEANAMVDKLLRNT